MKILMICLEYPPVNSTGNYRSAGLVRSLLKSEIEPVVLTATEETGITTFNKQPDNSLLDGLNNVKTYRLPITPLKRFYKYKIFNYIRIWSSITDSIARRWYTTKNKNEINRIILSEKPDLVYISLPPYSISKVALKIIKKHKIPLITDLRDAWSLWCNAPYSTRFHFSLVKKLEHKLFESSTSIICNTNEMRNDYQNMHQDISKSKFSVIYNGYDEMYIEDSELELDSSVYKIGYVGSFYYDPKIEEMMQLKWYKRKGLKKFYFTPRKEYWKYRSPYYFLKTLSSLIQINPDLKDKIVFEFIGRSPYWLDKMISDFDLTSNFVSHGFLPKHEVLKIQQNWNSILATSEKVEDGEGYSIPSKSFENIAVQKKILAFVSPGAQKKFLKNYSQVTFFEPDDVSNNIRILKDIIQSQEKNTSFDLLSKEFTRESQNNKFVVLIKNLLNK